MCGVPGSGNYMTWRIVARIQKQNDCFRSFKRSTGLTAIIEEFTDASIRDFQEEVEHDDIREGGVEFRHPPMRLIKPIDLDLVDHVSSLIWSHEDPLQLPWKQRSHHLYILRDGRDVVASMLNKVVRQRHRTLNPEYKATNMEEILELEVEGQGFVERCAHKWARHVRHYLESRDRIDWYVVQYEDLITSKEERVRELARHLGLECTDETLDMIMTETSKQDPRYEPKDHIWRGGPGGHEVLGITDRVEAVIRDELAAVGYLPALRQAS